MTAPDAAPFWEAVARRELHLRCAAPFFHPRTLCPLVDFEDGLPVLRPA